MTLHLYFGRRFLRSFFSVLFIFFAVLMLTGLIDQIRRYGGSDETSFATLLWLAVLSFLIIHTFYWTNARMRAPLTAVIVVLSVSGWRPLIYRLISFSGSDQGKHP